MSSETVLRPGHWLDRYELLGPLASGGMAKVWLARLRGKRGFEKLFAVKTVRAELAEDASFEEMFLDEARIASGIHHPNVAQILDLGEQDGILFLVMEWVDGESLGRIRKALARRDSTLPTGVVLRIIADACAGLHAAHELRDADGRPLSIVHRDVSPQNILVAVTGAVKVIDFGIAKAKNRRADNTRTGIVKGKPQYMAPEQVNRGRGIDRRTDVWALGACLHELLTGKVPYDVEDDLEVIGKLMTGVPPPPAQGLPEPVSGILERSLAIDPDLRFPTAAVMQRALEAALQELGEATTSEDVAVFVREECPELAVSRKALVSQALEDADRRVSTPPDDGDLPFAQTYPGASRPSDVGTAPILLRESDSKRIAATHSAVQLDGEPLVVPKRSYLGLWLLLGLGFAGVGTTLYVTRRAERAASSPAPALAPTTTAGVTASAAPSVPAPATAPPSATATATASVPAPAAASSSATAAASASAPAAAASSAPHPPPRRYRPPVSTPSEAPAAPTSTKPYSIYAPGAAPSAETNPY